MTSTSLEAIATGDRVTVTGDTMHGKIDDKRIDEWELGASRRALANLRELLFDQPMLDLLREQIEEADRRYRQYVAASDGKYTATRVILTVEGLSTATFLPTIGAMLAAAGESGNQRRQAAVDMAFPLHPEHYVMPPYRGVVETMGGIPTRTRVAAITPEDAPDFVTELVDESYPARLIGSGELEDGTPHSYVLQQFKDTPDGMEADLRIWYAAACPPAYIEEHAQHYAVEFRNGCRLAAAALSETR